MHHVAIDLQSVNIDIQLFSVLDRYFYLEFHFRYGNFNRIFQLNEVHRKGIIEQTISALLFVPTETVSKFKRNL